MYPVCVAERYVGSLPPLLLGVLLLVLSGTGGPARAQGLSALERQMEAVVRDSWGDASGAEARRLVQDDTQLECSRVRNEPGDALRERIQKRELARISYPEGALVLGDPVAGERYAKDGYGGRVGRLRPDDPARPRGGNCQACHVLEPRDGIGGTLGPSLAGFGIGLGTRPVAVRYVYDRIYNSHAVNPCSEMPRFGYHGFLTRQQILDIAAYLLMPDSPVNRIEAQGPEPAGTVRPLP
ncbi:sulfur oxidation c-type cytochrome SoxX [Thioalkalivibrio thiocyanodenitrificans]|uniref:sulfur oxidation c-type cytochrome SoxX n=1 Tax=Thioalkalivibrio thiocyanodenitrificans TaxID=243063 RepID=UPI000378B73B|nr:sulfur oxidation c-type cytochrome SoxX [Thioalkalivibrio thiocyanodenitrificans]